MQKRSSKKAPLDEYPLTEADQRAFDLPCWQAAHYPLSLQFVEAPGDLLFPHAWVRTSSFEWDGCGGRTDLHEVFGLLWALLLRTCGVASAGFVDEGGFAGPTEKYSRNLLFYQPFDRFVSRSNEMIKARLTAHTAAILHTLEGVLGLTPFDEVPPEWDEDCVRWQDTAQSAIGNSGDDAFWVERLNPDWRYYFSPEKSVTVVELRPPNMVKLRLACRHYAPVTIRQGNSLVLSASGMHHAVSMSALRRAEHVLRAVEGDASLNVGDGSNRWDSLQIMIVPLENCLVLIGTNFLVATATLCGYQPYLNARRRWEIKNRDAAAIFGMSGSIEWRDQISSERFAELVHALLKVEPGVSRVRSAGPHNERDQGRDLIVERATVVVSGETALTNTENVVVQVKTRKSTVGKRDVVDIRDTLGYHKSQAYLLVAYPRISNDLVKHLEVLGEDGVAIDWWTRSELEDRLRRHPHIASQFPDLLVHRAPN